MYIIINVFLQVPTTPINQNECVVNITVGWVSQGDLEGLPVFRHITEGAWAINLPLTSKSKLITNSPGKCVSLGQPNSFLQTNPKSPSLSLICEHQWPFLMTIKNCVRKTSYYSACHSQKIHILCFYLYVKKEVRSHSSVSLQRTFCFTWSQSERRLNWPPTKAAHPRNTWRPTLMEPPTLIG